MADLDAYLPKLRKTMLFSGIDDSGITALTGCMNVQVRQYEKGDILVLAGFPVESVGILLTGGIEAAQEDRDGRRLIISRMGPSEMFGEVLACSVRQKSPVTVYAIAQTQVLYIDYTRFSFSCEKACPHHTQALRNMMKIIADKYFTLNTRIRLLTMRGIRERITAYLLENARLSGDSVFVLPMNRTSLAAYLNIDRSAMTRELSKMQKEGLLRLNKNRCALLKLREN